MGPWVFLTRAVLAVAVAVAGLLAIALVVLLATAPEGMRLRAGDLPLLHGLLLSGAVATAAAAALAGLRGRRRWRWVAQGLLWAALAAVAAYLWRPGGP